MYYLKHSFQITTLYVDGKLAPLQELIQEMTWELRVNLSSASEYVPEIDRGIQATRENTRSIRHILPFNKVPKIFLIHLLFQAIKMLNYFNVKGGIY